MYFAGLVLIKTGYISDVVYRGRASQLNDLTVDAGHLCALCKVMLLFPMTRCVVPPPLLLLLPLRTTNRFSTTTKTPNSIHASPEPRPTEHRVVLAHLGQVLVQFVDVAEAVRTARAPDADHARVVVVVVVGGQHVAEVGRQQAAVGDRSAAVYVAVEQPRSEQTQRQQNDEQRRLTAANEHHRHVVDDSISDLLEQESVGD